MSHALKIPDAQAAVDKEWGKLKQMPARQVTTKNKNKKEVIENAQKEGRTVHFATLTDSCHLRISELEQEFQKKKKTKGVSCSEVML